MNKDQGTLVAEAEQLRRRWFRQLQAIEGEPNWHRGWERLEQLRSLIKQVRQLPVEDLAEEPVVQQLERILDEERDL